MSKPIVVFVDDDRFYANRWIERLRDKFTVHHFTDADDALQFLLSTAEIKCIILDVMMPVPATASAEETGRGYDTGLWLLLQVRSLVLRKKVPVIVLTNRDVDGVSTRVGDMTFKAGLVDVRRKLDTNRDCLLELVRDKVTEWAGESP